MKLDGIPAPDEDILRAFVACLYICLVLSGIQVELWSGQGRMEASLSFIRCRSWSSDFAWGLGFPLTFFFGDVSDICSSNCDVVRMIVIVMVAAWQENVKLMLLWHVFAFYM
jgi:hypothetical protein